MYFILFIEQSLYSVSFSGNSGGTANYAGPFFYWIGKFYFVHESIVIK